MADVTEPEDPTQNAPTDPTTPDTAPADDDSNEAPAVCAAGDDADPEACIGDEIKDPWDDAFQTDWPQNEVASA
jgi:hypothetical protein